MEEEREEEERKQIMALLYLIKLFGYQYCQTPAQKNIHRQSPLDTVSVLSLRLKFNWRNLRKNLYNHFNISNM